MAFLLAQFLERRIDARFDRPLPQDLRAEGMNGSDRGLFQTLQRVFERRRFEALLIELLAQTQFQFAGGFVREGDGGDFVDGRFLLAQAPRRCGRPVPWSCPCRPTLPRSGFRRAIPESACAPTSSDRRCGPGSRHPPDFDQWLQPFVVAILFCRIAILRRGRRPAGNRNAHTLLSAGAGGRNPRAMEPSMFCNSFARKARERSVILISAYLYSPRCVA